MTWPPADSSDARELRELDDSTLDDIAHRQRCRGGWLGRDEEDRAIPCPRCKPHYRRDVHGHAPIDDLLADEADHAVPLVR